MLYPSILLSILSLAAALAQPKPDFSQLEKVAREELRETNTPGAEVAVVLGDRVVFAKGFGVSDVETGAPMAPDLLCRIGSTTKMLTASVLVGLAVEGKVKLDEPVGKYITGLSPKIAALTGQQLLSHTAGLRDEAPMYGLHDDSALANTLRAWKDDYLFTEPGKIYSYANTGYHLAGLLIETVGGKPYADVMSERLFQPLGMSRTTLRPTMAMTWPLSQGHEAAGKARPTVIRPFADNAAGWPAGSVFTSAEDFARFTIAFLNDGRVGGRQVLSPAVISALSTPHADIPGDPERRYGYGLTIHKYRGVQFLEHGGARSGFGSFVRMAPQQRVAIILLVNKTGGSLPKTVEKATEMMLPLEAKADPQPKAPLPLTAAELAGYPGTYKNGESVAEILARDGKLYAKMSGPEVELTKTGADRLCYTPPGALQPQELVVVSGAGGQAEYLFGQGRALKKISQ